MRTLAACLVAALGAALPFAGNATAAGWRHWHGDALNTGFVDVVTAPAETPQAREVGPMAFGAGPVVGSDGTVYLATIDGLVRAFEPRTLNVKWTRQLRANILASPVIGNDGSLYVVGQTETVVNEWNRSYHAALYRLDGRTGEIRFRGQFPTGFQSEHGYTSASPTLWRNGTLELAMVPANYRRLDGSYTNNIVVFTMGGIAIWNHQVADVPPVTPPIDERTDGVPVAPPIVWPGGGGLMPSLGLYGPPDRPQQVIAADGYRSIVAYDFTPETGFRERGRKQLFDTRTAVPMSSPLMLSGDGHAIVRVGRFAYFGPPSPVAWPNLHLTNNPRGAGAVTPTSLGDGRIAFPASNQVVVAQFLPALTVVAAFGRPLRLPTRVAAAASRNHLYVSTTGGLVTFSTKLMGLASEFIWSNGGSSPPAIAGDGRVYAHANGMLFAFPAPAGCRPPRCGVVDRPAVTHSRSQPLVEREPQ